MTNSPPTHIGPYTILGLLGESEQEQTFLASHPLTGQKLTIKLFNPAELSQRMQTHLTAQLQRLQTVDKHHPHLVTIKTTGEFNNRPYVVLNDVPGGTLTERMQLFAPLPVAETWYILKGLAKALTHLHIRRVVHGQVEPDNIFLDSAGEPRLGLVRLLPAPDNSAFASPEQRGGELLDGRADLYSLAAVGYKMLTGEEPGLISPRPVTELRPELPRTFDQLFKKGLALDKNERFPSAGAFMEAFEKSLLPSTRFQTNLLYLGRFLPLPNIAQRGWAAVVNNLWFVLSILGGFVSLMFLAFYLAPISSTNPSTVTVTPTPWPTRIPPTSTPVSSFIQNIYGYSMALVPSSVQQDDVARPPKKWFVEEFTIDVQEVTNEQFLQYLIRTEANSEKIDELTVLIYNNSALANHPVTNVTKIEAGAYCAWREAKLPTHMQWQSSTGTLESSLLKYPWGSEDACGRANIANTYNVCDPFETSSPAGYFSPAGDSVFGVQDLAGNVAEWTNSTAEQPDGSLGYVVRGGSYLNTAGDVEIGSYTIRPADQGYEDVGFRCVRDN